MTEVIWQSSDRIDDAFHDTNRFTDSNGRLRRALIYIPNGVTGDIVFVLPSGKEETWTIASDDDRLDFNELKFQCIGVKATGTTIARSNVKLYSYL